MDIARLLDWLQQTSLAVQIRDSLFAFPLLEAAHVLGLALVFGTIAVVDLRLLGWASTHRPFGRVAADTLRWTWLAFFVTGVTGSLMFITNASVYAHNTYFRIKVVLLVLAAFNVLAFELTDGRSVREWGTATSAPPIGRVVGALSLVIWIGVIVTGRMIGFTVTRATLSAPAAAEENFEDLLGLPPVGDDTPPVPNP